ncbi:hypothetical protein [Methylobacterium terricola]|uniref:ribbon-helix-helix domain-containing protein n=1 Tax=Methylobacterium terricola TaxID=2583531 RepID=UPI0026961084
MQAAEKISITVTSEQPRAVRESVAAGEYASTSEVMRCACGSGSGSGSGRRMPNAWMPSALASAGRWTIRVPHSRSTKSTLTSNNYLPKRTKPRKTTAVRRLRVELQPEAVADLADIFRVV